MRSYKVAYGGAEWDAEIGDVVELELAAAEEEELVRRDRLTLLPQRYEVTGENEVHGHARGATFEAVLPLAQEAALIEGGHVKRVEEQTHTKTELLERAKALEVEGRSSMSKDELEAAIADAAHTDNTDN